MQFAVKTATLDTLATPCLVIGMFDGGKLPDALSLDKASQGYLLRTAKSGGMEGRGGQTLMLFE
ncbi:MAG TPA: M17 family peptidase N-terminal domain-containing protein, partial [Gammaproteobacteria bacterium]|nr:M17 family peptidase N-terminal domain-containing protein [Gammaproteobacteria bacterium]